MMAGLVGGMSFGGVDTDDVRMLATRCSLRFIHNPEPFLDPEATDGIMSLPVFFQEEFEEESDPLFGAYDVVKPPEKVIEEKTGDCEDAACLAASWILRHEPNDVHLVVFAPSLEDPYLATHIVAWDGSWIYDESGWHAETTPTEFAEYRDLHIVTETVIENHGQYHPD